MRVKFKRYFSNWIKMMKKGAVSEVTYRKYIEASEWVNKLAPDLYLDEMTRMDYQMLINEYGKSHELATVRGFMHMCNSCLADALYDDLVKKDLTYKVHATSEKSHKITRAKYLELKQSEEFNNRLLKDDNAEAWLCELDLRTGLRYGEALGLTPQDVDLKKHQIDVNKTLNYKFIGNDKWKATKNTSSVRVVSIDDKTCEILKKAMKECKDDDSIFEVALQKEHPKKRLKYLLSVSWINAYIARVCKECNLPRITFHNIRHTHASILILRGVSIQSVADRLGHATTATTQKFYIHLLQAAKDRDQKKINDALKL